MRFKGIKFIQLRNGEYVQFATSVINLLQQNDPAALGIVPQLAAFQSISDLIEDLYGTYHGSRITPQIHTLDQRRGRAISGIRLYLGGLVYHYDPAISAAAHTLVRNMKLHGAGIARQNYMAETANISHIIDHWASNAKLAAAVATLQLAPWLAELQAANDAFHTQYMLRTVENAAASPTNIKEQRVLSEKLYYTLRNALGALALVHNYAQPWGNAVNDLNALIGQYKTLLSSRAHEPMPQDEDMAEEL